MNLIRHKVDVSNISQPTRRWRSYLMKSIYSLLFISISLGVIYYSAHRNPAYAAAFGLGNDYEKIIELNSSLANNMPIPLDSITTAQTGGDKRVVALLIVLQKYQSPAATPAAAKAFVESADRYGFGDKWQLLAAISGVESGFCRIIPYKPNQLSYNCWGWGGPGRWVYFNSWEDAIDRISKGLANGYGPQNLVPERMVGSYCPPCRASAKPGESKWERGVYQYINEINNVYNSLN